MFSNLPRAVRAVRLAKGWSQQTLGVRAGVSRETISRTERGGLAGVTVGNLDRIASALGASVSLQLRWEGARLDRLLDAAHAELQQAVAQALNALGWVVRVEVSFNHYGDRGRVDILALHPPARVVLVVEIKSALGDLQDTLGRLDVKVRLGRRLAREMGWTDAAAVIPALVVGDSRTARNVVATHAALFARFGLRGRFAVAWIRLPREPWPSGLLWYVSRPGSHGVTTPHGQRPSTRLRSHLT